MAQVTQQPQGWTKEQFDQYINDAVAKQVDSKAKAIVDKIEPMIPALEKALGTAASKSGRSPQELMSMMAGDNGVPAYGLTQDGQMIPVARKSHVYRTKSIGKRTNPANGHQASFGEFLHHSWRVNYHGVSAAADSMEQLSKMGAYAIRQADDGRIVKTALAESSGVTGGYGVPPQYMEELQRLSVEDQILGSRARRLPMSTATLTIPSLDHTTAYGAGITPFLGGVQASWASEAGTIAESEPQFRQTELRANQLSLFIVVSNVLMQDQVVNLDTLVTELLSDADAFYSDYAYFNGNGAGQPIGVKNAGAAIKVNRASTGHFVYADVRAMMAKQIYNNIGDLIWVVHPSMIDDILGMNDTSGAAVSSDLGRGRLVFQPLDQGAQADIPRPAGAQSFGHFFGIPVFLSEKLSNKGTSGDAMLIDTSKYLIGERLDTQIEASPHPYFKTYQTVIRAVSRKDGQPWLNAAVTLADGTFTASPFVILN